MRLHWYFLWSNVSHVFIAIFFEKQFSISYSQGFEYFKARENFQTCQKERPSAPIRIQLSAFLFRKKISVALSNTTSL